MIVVNELSIHCEVEDIVNTLIQEGLLDSKTSNKNDYIMVCCPYHGEHRPSSSISTHPIQKGDKVVPSGFFNCFACKEKGNLFEFISQCLGNQDGGFSGIAWVRKHFKVTENEIPHVKLKSNISTRGREQDYLISEEVLDSYRYFHPYMYERHLNDEYIEYFDIGYDSETKTLTFPVKDLRGRVGYISRRSVNGRFHIQEKDSLKTNFIWGLYECLQELQFNPSQEVFICESVLNAIRYWQVGKLAVALMGTGGGEQYKLLGYLNCRSLVCSLDPDKAGKLGTQKIYQQLKNTKIIHSIIYPQWVIDEEKDINDLDDEDILELEYDWVIGTKKVGDI